MKFLIVFVALLVVAFANEVEIVKQVSEVGPEGYEYAVETSDGNKQYASAILVKDIESDEENLTVKGAYEWVDEKTGEKYTVEYVADEHGFQPTGAHLPVAPVA